MCETLTVSISAYRAWNHSGSPKRKRLTNARLLGRNPVARASPSYRNGIAANRSAVLRPKNENRIVAPIVVAANSCGPGERLRRHLAQ
jgi:hypothetical protein